MLNKKLNRELSFLLVLFLSASYTSATINGIHTNKNDSSVAVGSTASAAAPVFPLHPSMGTFIADYADDYDELFEKLKTTKSGYLKTIDKIFTQQSIPVGLKYMAIVESKLKTDARSHVGAVGLWQFMPETAKRFGLKITSKYDERQHVWKSSVAAAKYMNELFEIFEDWLLVVASYNSGPAPVLNAIKKSGSRNFWKLQNFLPKETRLHVKRFIATHYYFEGGGSLVTLGKAETESYLKKLEEFHEKNNAKDKEGNPNPAAVYSQWVAVVNNQDSLQLILKK